MNESQKLEEKMRKITSILTLVALLVVTILVAGGFTVPVSASTPQAEYSPYFLFCSLYESGQNVCRAVSECGLQVWGPYGDGHFEMEQVTCSTRMCTVGHVYATYQWYQCW